MTGRIGIGKIILGVIFLGFLVGPVAAEWSVSVPSHPNSAGGSIFTSEGKKTVIFVQVEDEIGEPITPDKVTDGSQFLYRYNNTDSSEYENLTHFQNSYWYAEFDSDITQHGVSKNKAEIEFRAQGDKVSEDDTSSGSWKTATTVLQIENYTVDIEEAPQMPLEPGETANISVNVTDREGVSTPGIEEVNVVFKNSTFSNSAGNLNYNSSSGLYEGGVTVPPTHDEEYLMTFIARERDSENFGAVSRFVNTTKDIEGKVESLTLGVGCESLGQSLPPRCEPGGSIDLSFNVTGIEVDNVTLSTHKVNRSSGEQVQVFNRPLEESEDLYSSEFDVPEINTTAFLDQIFVKVNMTKGDRSEVVEEVVNYRSIDMEYLASGSAYQGGDYMLQVQARKPVSFSPYGESGIHELRVNVTDSSGDLYENFTKSDFVFDGEDMVFEKAVDIASDAGPGGWGLEIFGAKYSQTDTVEDEGFRVVSSDVTFDVNETELLVDERGEQGFTMEVENLLENNITLRSNLSSELKPLMNITDDGRFNVSAGESEGVPVTVDMTDLSDDVLGEVNLTDVDTGFERQASVFLATPGCEVVNGSLCGTRDKWINVSVDSRNTTTEELEVFYTAGEGNSTDITVSKFGPIAQFIEINRTEYNITDSVTIDLNYTAGERGNFTGNIVIEAENGSTITYNTSLKANVTQLGTALIVENSPAELGTVPEGSSGSVEVQLQNYAGYTIENLIARSQLMDVSIEEENVNIQGESSKTLTVTYSDIKSLGAPEIVGTRPKGPNASATFSLDGTTVENYDQQIAQLENRIDQLSPVSDTNLSDTLEQVNGMIGEIEDEWSNGNYADAQDTYQQADSLLTYVANNKGTSDEEDDNEDRDTEDPDNEEQNDQNQDGSNQNQNQQQQSEGGGLPIIPIVVVLLIIVVIGVVVYESYIPEEGDPLYDLLGEE